MDQSLIAIFIQSADRRVNYQPIRYLSNGITLEMNLPIYKALKGVHWISWLMAAEPKGLNKINWKAIKAIGSTRRYNILVIYLKSEELTETCLPSFVVYFTVVYSGGASEIWLISAHCLRGYLTDKSKYISSGLASHESCIRRLGNLAHSSSFVNKTTLWLLTL